MNTFYQEPNVTVYHGHALDLKELPPESVNMCMTSPPYWGLRSYHTEPQIWDSKDGCRHEWGETMKLIKHHSGETNPGLEGAFKDKGAMDDNGSNFCLYCHAWRGELGLEPTIELYIKHLMQIFGEVKRVLKKTGTCWVNIDDSYASGKGTCFNPGGGKGSFSSHGDRKDSGIYPLDRGNISMLKAEGLLPKSLCLIPQRFAIAMVEQGWICRQDIVWNKPNPMPESVKDRFTTSWEHLFFFSKSKKYWFEQQFEQYTEPLNRWGGDTLKRDTSKTAEYKDMLTIGYSSAFRVGRPMRPNELGRNKRDVWEITTQPYPEAHFATYPEKLCETPILAGCPSMICKKCGKAREKVYETEKIIRPRPNPFTQPTVDRSPSPNDFGGLSSEFQGYTDCGCNAGFEPGVVLDPFMGSGTTLAVAKRLGRKAIGIDINPDYCKLTVKRIQEISMPMDLSGGGHG